MLLASCYHQVDAFVDIFNLESADARMHAATINEWVHQAKHKIRIVLLYVSVAAPAEVY